MPKKNRADAEAIQDSAAIQEVIDKFVEGIRSLNPDLMCSVFHPEAVSLSMTSSGICVESADSWTEILGKAKSDSSHLFNEKFVADTLSIDVVGAVASAKVQWIFQSCKIVDFYNLIRTEIGWLIANQVYHTTRLEK